MTKQEPSLSAYVYDKIMLKICNGGFSAGAKLPSEESLAREYGVSRPIIREALRQLRVEGVIESRRGAGSFLIRTPQPALSGALRIENWTDILHCYEYRAYLESRIAGLAASRATAEERDEIMEIFERQKREFFACETPNGRKNEETRMDLDTDFHMTIARATHNRFYIQALQAMRNEMRQSMYMIVMLFQSHQGRHYEIISEEHGWIVNAILAGDSELASAAMKVHILNARDSLLPTQKTNAQQGLIDPAEENFVQPQKL